MVLCNVYAVYIKIMNNENQTIHKFDFNLNWYGWNDKLSQLKQESLYSTLPHGRISIVHRTCYEVVSENGLFQCELTGNMMYGKSDAELPCTGDWVLFQPFDENKGIIVYMLPRERTLYRKKSGTVADKQAIASYVDKAFIVQSLDDNFNVRRVERFMVQVLEENIKPVLVLNKSDLDFDRQSVEEQINHISNQVQIKEYWQEEYTGKSKKEEDFHTKVPLAMIEKDLRKSLRKIGITDDAIRTQEIGDYWRQRGKEFLIGKQLDIRLTDFEQINSIIRSVNTWGIESMRIGELKHKDLPMYRKQGKIEALKAAREKASYLVEAMGQQLGEVIRIIEPADNNISRYLPFEAQSNVSMGAAATEQYRVIKLRYEMTARFAIK